MTFKWRTPRGGRELDARRSALSVDCPFLQESTEFADANILADWEVPDINKKPQRRVRA